jgi:murein L,D-transpeptidase YcbB/YkuD
MYVPTDHAIRCAATREGAARGARRRRAAAAVAVCALLAGCARPRATLPHAVVDGATQTIAAAVASAERGEQVVVEGQALASTVALSELYRRREFAPAWTKSAAVDDVLRAIRESFDDGLEPEDYHLAAIDRVRGSAGSSPEARARLDLLVSDAAILLAHDLRYGKLGPVALDAAVKGEGSRAAGDLVEVLARGLREGNVHETLDGLKPRHPFYTRLKAALAEHRRMAAAGGWVDVPEGGPLAPGVKDARVALLRRRLAATGDLPAGAATDASPRYDAVVEAGVRAFQARHGLQADGAVGASTMRALNVPVEVRIAQIRATLERCRWVMQDLPDRFVLVDVAGFTVAVVENDLRVWESRAIVGDRFTQTPSFRADMRSIVLNPKWTIPPGIMKNEIGPAMQRDPGYLRKKGYAWVNGQLVQPPGPKNPLGRIKLLLPNPHHVYLHDTPSKAAFNRTTRTFSHGCVRVEKPFELAALALDEPAWTAEALADAAANGKTRTIPVPRPLPVLVLYWTVSADADGRVRFTPDVYDQDPAVIEGLAKPVAPPHRSLVRADPR